MKIAVAIFLFQRSDNIIHLYRESVRAGIKDIYLFVDGPKHDGQDAKYKEILSLINREICGDSVKVVARGVNLGLKKNVIFGVSEVLRYNDAIIVLEDDLRLAKGFFAFMINSLIKYEYNNIIGSVSGSSFVDVGYRKEAIDWYISRYTHSWGWATWKDRWEGFNADTSISNFNWKNNATLVKMTYQERLYWINAKWMCRMGLVNSWAYPWSFYHFNNGLMAVVPIVNLVKNIGFDKFSTHTKKENDSYSRLSLVRCTEVGVQLKQSIADSLDNIESNNLYNATLLYVIYKRLKYVLFEKNN